MSDNFKQDTYKHNIHESCPQSKPGAGGWVRWRGHDSGNAKTAEYPARAEITYRGWDSRDKLDYLRRRSSDRRWCSASKMRYGSAISLPTYKLNSLNPWSTPRRRPEERCIPRLRQDTSSSQTTSGHGRRGNLSCASHPQCSGPLILHFAFCDKTAKFAQILHKTERCRTILRKM